MNGRSEMSKGKHLEEGSRSRENNKPWDMLRTRWKEAYRKEKLNNLLQENCEEFGITKDTFVKDINDLYFNKCEIGSDAWQHLHIVVDYMIERVDKIDQDREEYMNAGDRIGKRLEEVKRLSGWLQDIKSNLENEIIDENKENKREKVDSYIKEELNRFYKEDIIMKYKESKKDFQSKLDECVKGGDMLTKLFSEKIKEIVKEIDKLLARIHGCQIDDPKFKDFERYEVWIEKAKEGLDKGDIFEIYKELDYKITINSRFNEIENYLYDLYDSNKEGRSSSRAGMLSLIEGFYGKMLSINKDIDNSVYKSGESKIWIEKLNKVKGGINEVESSIYELKSYAVKQVKYTDEYYKNITEGLEKVFEKLKNISEEFNEKKEFMPTIPEDRSSCEASTSGLRRSDVSQGKQPEVQEQCQYYSFSRDATSRGEFLRSLKRLEKDCCPPQDGSLRPQIDIGQQLGGYSLDSKLGKGRFGEVFLGEHVDSGEKVAIKVLKLDDGSQIGRNYIEDFCKEMKNMACLDHPNIMPLLGFGSKDHVPFLVMEYMPGGDLFGKCLSLTEFGECMKQICSGVHHIHENGLIHRDLKLENILLNENDEAVIGDLGSVALFGAKDLAGTLVYVAPEQLKREACPQSDVYALGLIAFQLLTGKRLVDCVEQEQEWRDFFDKENEERKNNGKEQMSEHEKYLYLHERTSDWIISGNGLKIEIEPEIREVLACTLKKNPKERFQSAMKFEQALEQAIEKVQQREAAQELERQEAQQRELVRELEKNKYRYMFMKNERILKGYRLFADQKIRTKLYKILICGRQRALVRGLESDEIRNLYLDIEEQKERTKLFKMLTPEQRQNLVTGLATEGNEISNLYRDIREKMEKKCFGRHLDHRDGRRFLVSCWLCFGRPRIEEER
jgi:serine/threonine protein kinase